MSPPEDRTIPVRTATGTPGTCVDAEPFALRVTDDSMAPEFPAGCVVIVDPSVAPADGRFVVANTAAGPVLRRARASAGGWRLEALAPGHRDEALDAGAIAGCVTQRAGRRRRDHKRFD